MLISNAIQAGFSTVTLSAQVVDVGYFLILPERVVSIKSNRFKLVHRTGPDRTGKTDPTLALATVNYWSYETKIVVVKPLSVLNRAMVHFIANEFKLCSIILF